MKPTVLCRRCWSRLQWHRATPQIYFYSSTTAALSGSNYYELLRISKSASTAEIKAAYIEMSKLHHPDMNPGKQNLHDHFVRINKAYEVLSKPHARRDYDHRISRSHQGKTTYGRGTESHNPFNATRQDSGWYRDFADTTKKNQEASNSYYGFKGQERVENHFIVVGCIIIVVFTGSIVFGLFRIRSWYTISMLDAKDQRISRMYNEVRANLRENGNEKQLQMMRERHQEFHERRAAKLNAKILKTK